ncbi:type II toxin-antitoxin system RelE/ParE family toxin [Salinarimonas rosea]|uniref:type II toxin-antitoxin system RelE/ParE family toxin n=1 Tax=Salinarimonas rosea TaxID=552063 RepID=UPI00048ECC9A|nr:type II toxin-antitoxin system RelE/ParE family toxin [Salinarimonas rosea]
MHTVLETNAFRRAADQVALSEDDRLQIAALVSGNPTIGDLIPGTGGARKFRYAPPGRGKRGGYRVIFYFAADDVPVFLMDIYAKGEKITLSKGECNALAKILGSVAEDYRASASQKLRKLVESSR